MKQHTFAKLFLSLALVVLAVGFTHSAVSADTVITLLNPPDGGVLYLEPGESYTFNVVVDSDIPFLTASVMPDQYFPGRGVFFNKGDHVAGGTTADLQLTVTGKNSTADLPGGFAPISVMVGVRFPGGQITVAQYDYQVYVP